MGSTCCRSGSWKQLLSSQVLSSHQLDQAPERRKKMYYARSPDLGIERYQGRSQSSCDLPSPAYWDVRDSRWIWRSHTFFSNMLIACLLPCKQAQRIPGSFPASQERTPSAHHNLLHGGLMDQPGEQQA